MGLFLALSGVVAAGSEDAQAALSDFADKEAGGFELSEGTTDKPNVGVVTTGGPNTTVLYPDGFCEWDDASRHISERLARPVFSLHIHDGDLWMYVLFRDGRETGRFNPVPNYWKELASEETARWQGDASMVADVVPGVSADAITKYFVEWDVEEESPAKAYADDEFATCDCWQMCDFMRKIGLEFPVADDGSIQGSTFRFWTQAFPLREPPPSAPPKPWWKLW